MRVFSTLLLLSLPAASIPARAIAAEQSSIASSVRAGERVRITKGRVGSVAALIGIFRAAGPESIEVSQSDPHGGAETRLSIPIDDLATIEVSRGRTHQTLAGILVGFLAGAAVTAAIFASASNSGSEIPPVGALIYPVAGALAGGMVGGGVGSDRWEKVWAQPAKP